VGTEVIEPPQHGCMPPPDSLVVPRANAFAMGLKMTSEFEAAARVFDLLGHHVGGWTWNYCGDPVEAFTEAREQAYAKVTASSLGDTQSGRGSDRAAGTDQHRDSGPC